MPPRVPTPSHETTYQRQLQDAWEEGYDTVMKSPSQHARTPLPSRTVHMRSPSPRAPTHVILPLPRRRISPPRAEAEDPISLTLQWLVKRAPKPPTPPQAADFTDYK